MAESDGGGDGGALEGIQSDVLGAKKGIHVKWKMCYSLMLQNPHVAPYKRELSVTFGPPTRSIRPSSTYKKETELVFNFYNFVYTPREFQNLCGVSSLTC